MKKHEGPWLSAVWGGRQVTKRVDSDEQKWRNWNWRSDGDILVNGAYFVSSGEGLEVKYEKAYSVEPKSATFIDQLTMNAGVFGSRSLHFLSLTLTFWLYFFLYLAQNLLKESCLWIWAFWLMG